MLTAIEYWYDMLSADGREDLLFGRSYRRQVLDALRSCMDLQQEYYTFAEFPLIGEPYLDFAASQMIDTGIQKTAQGAYKLFKNICYEFDLSKEDHPQPATLISNMSVPLGENPEKCILHELGADALWDIYQEQINKTPDSFILRYSGIFSGREDSPLRMAYHISKKRLHDYQENINLFREDMQVLGYKYVCDDMINMLKMILPFVQGQLEVSIDLLRDGSIGPKAGMVLFAVSPHMFPTSREDFYGSPLPELFKVLEEGVIDHRWEKLLDTLYAVSLQSPFELHGRRILSMNQMHSIKFSWSAGQRKPPKIYMRNHTIIP